jgi:hypothetical protein
MSAGLPITCIHEQRRDIARQGIGTRPMPLAIRSNKERGGEKERGRDKEGETKRNWLPVGGEGCIQLARY